MRRFWNTISRRKWLWTLATAALFALWILSGKYYVAWWSNGFHFARLTSGMVDCGYLGHVVGFSGGGPPIPGYHIYSQPRWNLRFEFRCSQMKGFPLQSWEVNFPLGLLCLPPAALAIASWRRHIQLRRSLRSLLCPSCGYPRQGLAPHAPCPECGKSSPTPA